MSANDKWIVQAATEAVDTLTSDADIAWMVAPKSTCRELDSLATLMVAVGNFQGAVTWIEGHTDSESEDAGDSHYQVDPSEYVAENLMP